jgi:hypothetical protein
LQVVLGGLAGGGEIHPLRGIGLQLGGDVLLDQASGFRFVVPVVVEAILDGPIDHVPHHKAGFAQGPQLVEEEGVVFVEALGRHQQETVEAGQVEPLDVSVLGPAPGAAAREVHEGDAPVADLQGIVGGFHHPHLGNALAGDRIDQRRLAAAGGTDQATAHLGFFEFFDLLPAAGGEIADEGLVVSQGRGGGGAVEPFSSGGASGEQQPVDESAPGEG